MESIPKGSHENRISQIIISQCLVNLLWRRLWDEIPRGNQVKVVSCSWIDVSSVECTRGLGIRLRPQENRTKLIGATIVGTL